MRRPRLWQFAAMLTLPIPPAIEEVPPLASAWHPSGVLLGSGAVLLILVLNIVARAIARRSRVNG